MIKAISITNFRGFRRFELDDCPRVNLFTGLNGVGKTALLEAVFLMLGPGNPELSVRLNGLRGIPTLMEPEEIWGWIFNNRNVGTATVLHSDWMDGTSQELKLSLSTSPRSLVGADGGSQASLTTEMSRNVLQMDFTDARGQRRKVSAKVEGNVLQVSPAAVSAEIPGIFLATQARSVREDAQRFSYLDDLHRTGEVIEAARTLEPRLKRLSVAAVGNESVLRADIGLGRLVPVPLVGAGFARLVSTLLAVAFAREGVVLIDEIDNGLHHSRMVDVWRSVASLARTSGTQIFATTHSGECIRAAHDAFTGELAGDFRLVRLDRRDIDVRPVIYDREMLDTAVRAELEVR